MLRYDPEHMPLVLPRRTQVAWTYPEVMEAAASGVDSFVRRARLKLDTDQNPRYLKDALILADMAIAQTAAALRVKPISYRYFLYHGTSPSASEWYDSGSHPLIPDGFSLVAMVENVHPTVTPEPSIQARLASRMIEATRRGGLLLGDLNLEHIAYDTAGQGHLVDVDAEISGCVESDLSTMRHAALS